MDSQFKVRVEPGAEIDLPADDAGKFVAIPEEPKSDTPRRPGLEIGQNVNVASERIEIGPQHGAEHSQPHDASVATECRQSITIKPNRELLDIGDHLSVPRTAVCRALRPLHGKNLRVSGDGKETLAGTFFCRFQASFYLRRR